MQFYLVILKNCNNFLTEMYCFYLCTGHIHFIFLKTKEMIQIKS